MAAITDITINLQDPNTAARISAGIPVKTHEGYSFLAKHLGVPEGTPVIHTFGVENVKAYLPKVYRKGLQWGEGTYDLGHPDLVVSYQFEGYPKVSILWEGGGQMYSAMFPVAVATEDYPNYRATMNSPSMVTEYIQLPNPLNGCVLLEEVYPEYAGEVTVTGAFSYPGSPQYGGGDILYARVLVPDCTQAFKVRVAKTASAINASIIDWPQEIPGVIGYTEYQKKTFQRLVSVAITEEHLIA